MCGIFGIYGENEFHFCKKNLDVILSTINNRGPDSSGFYEDHNCNLLFGHTRLSIIDLSNHGSQPMISRSKNYIISFNGEIYNHAELRDNLISKNISFKGESDTESLIEHISHFGLTYTLNKIRGMFAFSLYDKKNDQVFLIRDKFGEKPLYYYNYKNTLYFSSSLETFKKIPNLKLKIDKNALNIFLKRGYIPNSKTIYENIFKVEKSTLILFKKLYNNQIIKQSIINWFEDKKKTNKNENSLKQNSNTLENLLNNSVKEQLVADVPVGVLLSGGVDSSLVATLASKISNNKINTFTVGFKNSKYDESSKATKIANYLKTNHQNYILDESEALQIISDLPNVFSEPFADSSQIPQILLSKYVSKNVKVVLSGDGGDELFGGYNRYIHTNFLWKIFSQMPVILKKLILKSFLINSENTWDNIYKYFLNYFHSNKIAFFGNKVHKFSSAGINSLTPLDFYNNINCIWSNTDEIENYQLDKNIDNLNYDSNKNIIDNFMEFDLDEYLPDDILCKVDRSSMYYSLESRAPFLNIDIYKFIQNVPIEQKVKSGSGKIILKSILNNHLPEKLFNLPKQGFSIPLSDWIKGSLRDIINDNLTNDKIINDGHFNHKIVHKILDEHMKGKFNHDKKIWTLFNYFLWKNTNK